ncbi:AAEL006490-PA, partial [Aedes aegypti]
TQLFCPRRFDGWTCWESQPAGTIAQNFCPNFVLGFDASRLAYRICHANGSWFTHPESGREWSNYTNCIDVDDMKFRRLVNDLYIGGYTISLVTLIVSLCDSEVHSHTHPHQLVHIPGAELRLLDPVVQVRRRRSRCNQQERGKCLSHSVHQIAILINWCIALHILLHYLMLVNYFWMFCEGLQLHLVLVIRCCIYSNFQWKLNITERRPSFLGGNENLSVYYEQAQTYSDSNRHQPPSSSFAEGKSIFLMSFFTLTPTHVHVAIFFLLSIRFSCWMNESHAMWLLTIPVCFSLVASLVFLINVVRVLLTKLNSTSPNPAPLGLKKATRATLILIPLFGLQHILLPFRPDKGCELERYYQVVSAVLISLQGACVSCLFCFANHDVIFAIKCQLSRFFPTLVHHPFRESYNGGQPATQSRDMVV